MKYFYVAVLAACVVGALSFTVFSEFDDEWEAWKLEHGKSYSGVQEEARRRQTWQNNLRNIVKHNLEFQRGVHTYELGMNEFGDMENEEFVAMMNGYSRNASSKASGGSTFLPPSNVEVPKSVDWRTKGYVTGVKNQLQCGSCWAFSATGSLEGQHFKSTGKLVSLSEQNLMDCSRPEGNMACEGGLMDQAFEYIKKNKGIDTEANYPYLAKDETKCKYNVANRGATCTGYTDIPRDDEMALQQAVATVGPISVAIDASHMSFQMYKSGVYNEPKCSSTQLDHGVLAVGYGVTMDGVDYWIVKNSWGASWGMKGYIWMSRNKDNQCGIATSASYPMV